MKYFVLTLLMLITGNIFATPGIHEALKNPSTVTILKFSGEKDEASLFLKNAYRFKALTHVQLSGISDSLIAEQDIAAIASCSSVTKISFDKCGFSHLSGAVKMLVSVKEVEISDCAKLDIDGTFSTLAGMPSLKSISYSTAKLIRLPKSFIRMRGLTKISIHNTDLSLADGYALNNSKPQSLIADERLELGFGADILALEYSCYDKKSAKEHIGIMRDMLQGAVGMNGEMVLPQRNVGFTRQNPLVQPPILGLDVFKSVYSTSAKTGGIIEYPSGTKILIPSNAFVDANGNEVKGNVTIDYREFRDPVDILVSGIPMVYDSAGQKGDFESAGMFELNASVNGNEVFLAPDKKVDVQFAVVDTASTFNFYRLDPVAGWVYQSATGQVETKANDAAATVVSKTTTLVRSEAALDFLWRTGSLFRKRPNLNDTTSFERIYDDTNYFYMSKHESSLRMSGQKKNKKSTQWRMRKVSSGKDGYYFSFSNESKNVNFGYHNPEMSPYRRVTWRLNEKLDKETLKKLRSSSSGINDLRVTYLGDSEYTIELKLATGFVSIAATPVYLTYKKERKPISERRCIQMDRQYNKILKNRKKGFTNAINHRVYLYQRWEGKMHQDSLKQWSASRKMMDATEASMDFPSWVNYAKKFVGFNSPYGASAEVLSQSGVVYQALSVMKFGIYNCDQIQRISNPVQVMAIAYSLDGVPQNSGKMFVIDKKRNQVFTYQGFSGQPISITFGARAENKLIIVNADGTIALTDTEMFNARKQTAQGNTRFPTVPLSDKPISTQELREFIYPPDVTPK